MNVTDSAVAYGNAISTNLAENLFVNDRPIPIILYGSVNGMSVANDIYASVQNSLSNCSVTSSSATVPTCNSNLSVNDIVPTSFSNLPPEKEHHALNLKADQNLNGINNTLISNRLKKQTESSSLINKTDAQNHNNAITFNPNHSKNTQEINTPLLPKQHTSP